VLEQAFENAVAVLVNDIVAFEDLHGHINISEDERAEALADHGAHGGGHRSEFFGNLGVLHFAEGDDALGEIHGKIADALKVIVDF
jgi:hypothetical protein